MRISILTLFPEFFDGFLTNSIIKRAIAKEQVEIEIVNIRDFICIAQIFIQRYKIYSNNTL